jgi:hypothetical protein
MLHKKAVDPETRKDPLSRPSLKTLSRDCGSTKAPDDGFRRHKSNSTFLVWHKLLSTPPRVAFLWEEKEEEISDGPWLA